MFFGEWSGVGAGVGGWKVRWVNKYFFEGGKFFGKGKRRFNFGRGVNFLFIYFFFAREGEEGLNYFFSRGGGWG